MKSATKLTIGWREWVALPDLHVTAIKAKIDTGAHTSALHTHDVRIFRHRGVEIVRFKLHPLQRDSTTTVEAEARLVDERWVTSSSGHRMLRPVIVTAMELMGRRWEIELTLTNRDAMGFRMLLGREAVRGRCIVDPGRSFRAGRRAASGKKRLRARRGGSEHLTARAGTGVVS